MTYIYILRLEEGKYYVGKTQRPKIRISDHFKCNGCAWTQEYKPVKIINIIPNCDNYDEDKYTLQYMQRYGIDNVRGGSFTKYILEYSQIKIINTMLKSNNDMCFKCGKKGHFADTCLHSKVTVDTTYSHTDKLLKCEYSHNDTLWECEYCGKEFKTKKGCLFHENIHCKKKHIDYYSNTDEDNDEYEEASYNYIGHQHRHHRERQHIRSSVGDHNKSNKKTKSQCYRCGRLGHYSKSCYAKKHINGYYL